MLDFFQVSISVILKYIGRNGAAIPGDCKIFCCAIANKMVISQMLWIFQCYFFGR